jgi:ubiquinone/menaquinone biosynthesis C-methylase UbiE
VGFGRFSWIRHWRDLELCDKHDFELACLNWRGKQDNARNKQMIEPDQTPDPEYDYETIAVGYYDEIFHRNKGVQSKWHQQKFARIRTEIGRPKKHLDIACGPGTFIGTLTDEIESVGVDIAKNQIDYATKTYGGRTGAHFQQISEGPLPFEKGQFDCISIVELIEHLKQGAVQPLLVEACRVLQPGGRIIVTTPDYGGLWPAVEWFVNRLGDISYEDQHINKFRKKRLYDTLEASGFRNINIKSYLFAAPFAAALGWRFADMLEAIEPAFLVDHLGLCLLATAEAP